jgi:hypothetical protein
MALVACAALAAAAGSAGAADVLEVVPSDAMGVLVINNLGQTDAKVQQLAGQLQLPQVAMLTKIKSDLGLEKGIDDTGSLAVAAVVPGDGTAPVAVAYVPTGDYAELLKQLKASVPTDGVASFTAPDGDSALIAELGGFAVVTESSNRAALDAALSMKRSIAADTPSLETWRTQTQVYAIATPAGVRFAQQQILAGLALAKQQMRQAGPQAEQAVFGIEIYENLFKNLDREVTSAAVGLRIEDSGDVRIIGRTLLAEGGVLASMAAGAKPEWRQEPSPVLRKFWPDCPKCPSCSPAAVSFHPRRPNP